MLFNGAVTLTEDSGCFVGEVELDEPMVEGKKVTITVGDSVCCALVESGAGYGIYANAYNAEGDPVFEIAPDGTVTAYSPLVEEAGSYDIKIEQGEIEYTTLFDGDIEVAQQVADTYGVFEPSPSPTLYALTNLIVNDADEGTAGWSDNNANSFDDDYTLRKQDDDYWFMTDTVGTYSVTVRQDTSIFMV